MSAFETMLNRIVEFLPRVLGGGNHNICRLAA